MRFSTDKEHYLMVPSYILGKEIEQRISLLKNSSKSFLKNTIELSIYLKRKRNLTKEEFSLISKMETISIQILETF